MRASLFLSSVTLCYLNSTFHKRTSLNMDNGILCNRDTYFSMQYIMQYLMQLNAPIRSDQDRYNLHTLQTIDNIELRRFIGYEDTHTLKS